jgi:hypothetical protein
MMDPVHGLAYMCDGSCLRKDGENHSSLASNKQGERSLKGRDTGSGIGPSACRAHARCFVCGRMERPIHAFPSLYRGSELALGMRTP